MISSNNVHPPIKEIFIPEEKNLKRSIKKITLKHRKVSVKTFRSLISVTSLVIILKLKTVRRDNILHSPPSRPCSILVLSNYDSCCHCFYAMAGTQCTVALHLRIVTEATKLMTGILLIVILIPSLKAELVGYHTLLALWAVC